MKEQSHLLVGPVPSVIPPQMDRLQKGVSHARANEAYMLLGYTVMTPRWRRANTAEESPCLTHVTASCAKLGKLN